MIFFLQIWAALRRLLVKSWSLRSVDACNDCGLMHRAEVLQSQDRTGPDRPIRPLLLQLLKTFVSASRTTKQNINGKRKAWAWFKWRILLKICYTVRGKQPDTNKEWTLKEDSPLNERNSSWWSTEQNKYTINTLSHSYDSVLTRRQLIKDTWTTTEHFCK